MTNSREYFEMRKRAYRSVEETRAFVLEKHAQGSLPHDIANLLGINADDVRLILRSTGIEPHVSAVYEVSSMWGLPDNERRLAFARRAAAGAKATLCENAKRTDKALNKLAPFVDGADAEAV